MTTGPELYRKARRLIPGGTQLLSKRPEMFLPEQWPAYFTSAKGIEVVDLQGRRYTDMGMMGIGACVLGYADPEVDDPVVEAIRRGVASTLNPPEEVELAELLCELHPWAQMARFMRSGGEAMAAAVRIARAHTGREKVAFCGYHGWSDWYLAANLGEQDALDGHLLPGLKPAGVPRSLRGTALPFHYNRIDELKSIVSSQGRELAAIVMEPRRGEAPQEDFLKEVRAVADETGAVLIFDEITTGFRMTTGGIHLTLGVEPDIAVFAKAMANGYAMAAVIGRGGVMQAAQSTFMSSTNWTERIGPVAALATIRKHRREKVAEHLKRVGAIMTQGWESAAAAAGLKIRTGGLPSLTQFSIDGDGDRVLMTLFVQGMLERGYLAASQFKVSFAHQESDIRKYLVDAEAVFRVVAEAQRAGDVRTRLKGPPAHSGFARLTE